MYNLPHFKEKDPAIVREFMRQHPFALLCGCGQDLLPVATQVPLIMEERGDRLFLTGHIQRKTDHHLAFMQNPQVLVVYTGPHAYVSASWYSNPQTASTWNYMAVHARGRLQFLDDKKLLDILDKLTGYFENDPHSPALMEHMPEEYVQKMMQAIVAFEIEITSLDHVFKLSQNRDEKSYVRIIDHLSQAGGQPALVAREMEKRRYSQFGQLPRL